MLVSSTVPLTTVLFLNDGELSRNLPKTNIYT